MGSIPRIPKGIYRQKQTFWLRWTPVPGAPQVRQSLGTRDLAEAITEAARIRRTDGPVKRQAAGTCAAEVERYTAALRKDKLSDNTVNSREYVLNAFVAHVGVSSPRSISTPMIQKWHDGIAANNPHTAEAYVKYVRWWLAWLMEQGRLARNPAADVKIPELPMRTRRKFMRAEQVRTLLEACKDDELKFAIYCAAHAGFRKDEVIEALPLWFDMSAKLIHIDSTRTFEPKDREKRTIPMTDEFHQFLEEFGLGYPFMLRPAETHGKAKYRTDFQKSYANLLERCGLSEFTFHDLRRTFASLLVSAGISIYKVAKWLGDTIEVVENTYGHLIPQDDDVNASWSKAAPPAPAPAPPDHADLHAKLAEILAALKQSPPTPAP